MSVEVLVATMNAKNFNILESLRIDSDVIIANQADCFCYEEMNYRGHSAKMITTATRGASLNRNIAIALSNADILFICDDDATLPDGYEDLIEKEFYEHPYADAIKFFCVCTTPDAPLSLKRPTKFRAARRFEVFSAGIHAFAIKKSIVEKYDIRFMESIGAGKIHNCGEDSIFLRDLIRNGIKVFLSTIQIGTITRETSTWFTGYNESYFINSGYVYSKLYGRLAILAACRKAIKMKHNKKTDYSISDMIKYMYNGIREERK